MRTPPVGTASTQVWVDFNKWANAHSIPNETEDWEYLWGCFLAGAACGVRSNRLDASDVTRLGGPDE